MESPNSWAKATVKNDWGSVITNVQLNHRYDNDHSDALSWASLEKGLSGTTFDVGYWTGFLRTGKDYWLIKFDADGKTWTCKDNFYCFLTDEDIGGTVVCRVFKDGNRGKMEVICPKSSNATVSLSSQSAPASATRPVYIIGHRCNDQEDVGLAISRGCNAIECDLQYDKDDNAIHVNHDYAIGTVLSKWLSNAKAMMQQYPEQFALIIFDCKFATSCDSSTTADVLFKIRQAVRDQLNAGEDVPINVIFSIADFKNKGGFNRIMNTLQANEGIAVDYHDNPADIEKFFKDNAVRNGWYGDGIMTLAPNWITDVFPPLKQGCTLRDTNGIIKKTYVWTLADKDSIRKFIVEGPVDGVMVNVSGTLPILSPSGHTEAVEVVNESAVAHFAKRRDPAFKVYNKTVSVRDVITVCPEW